MSTPSSPPSPPVDSGRTASSLFPPIQSGLKTPERKPDAARSVPDPTPLTIGSSILHKLQPNTNQASKYDITKYEQYIIQDFERHRVFVDIEVFMKRVLHVPENWKKLWGPTIRRIKRNGPFSIAHLNYTRKCETQGIEECEFYGPLVDMGNAILDVSGAAKSPRSNKPTKPRTPQSYLVNDPQKVLCGVMNNLSPDIVAVHKHLLSRILPEEREKQYLKKSILTWAQPLHALEVKPWDNALVDGSCMPRLKVDGKDPQDGHARAYTPSRYQKRGKGGAGLPEEGLPVADGVVSAPNLLSRKRPADESFETNRKSQKVHHRSTPGGSGDQAAERKPRSAQTYETDRQRDAYLQVGRYLLEQFSVPAFRSHATIGLVDRDRIQFYHANHSVILVSSAINFSVTGSEGVDKFIAIVIAFSRLSLRDNGILHNLHDGKLFRDNGKLPTSKLARGAVRIQEGNKLEFGGDEKTGPFTLTYGKVISHEPSLAGRSTAVLHAESPKWGELELVVKISWPGSERVPEGEFLKKAIEVAESTPGGKWAVNHLPRVLFAQDVVFDPDSTQEKVASLFDGAEFVDEEYKYERRTLRIIIQELLHPITTLANVKHIGQALVDVACVHRWLHDRVGILHRDLSLNNIMCRIIKEKNKAGVREIKEVYGVLTDYDLSSWTASLTSDYIKTSQQRTGTPPFMAHGLLDGTDTLHLYRHDVESLFYIILILATRYEIEAPKKGNAGGVRTRQGLKVLPYQAWFDQPSYETLAESKQAFISNLKYLNLSPTFEDFRGWLEDLHLSFQTGFISKQIHRRDLLSLQRRRGGTSEGRVIPTFDNETLAGHIQYSALVEPASSLKGGLEGLIVRYKPSPSSPPTSTGAAKADS